MSDNNKIGWRFDNTYSKLPDTMMSKLSPIPVKKPELVILNNSLSEKLGLDFFKSLIAAANMVISPGDRSDSNTIFLSPEDFFGFDFFIRLIILLKVYLFHIQS